MGISLDFHEEDWNRVEAVWGQFWAGELDRPVVMLERVELLPGGFPDAPDFLTSLPFDLAPEDVIERYEPTLRARRFYGDSFPKWWLNFGPGIAAGFLGAKVHAVEDTVWFEPENIVPIQDLHLEYLPDNPWWRKIQRLAECAAERWVGQVAVGLTDLGGNLDILASFRTSQGLALELLDEPAEVLRLTGEITAAWLRYYDEHYAAIRKGGRGCTPWAPIWSPGKTYMLQSDFSYMISPKMFEKFVLPDLIACCDMLDHGFYHLDGKGEIPHLDWLLSIDRLRGIQWVPGDGSPTADHWLPLLQRIRAGGKLCQVSVPPEGALRIVRELGGKGFVLDVCADGLSHEEAQALVKELTSA